MDCRTIPYRRTPHPPKLFLQFVEDYQRVSRFYAHPPRVSAIPRFARGLKFPKERRQAVAAVLREQSAVFGSGAGTAKNLARLERGAVAVVSGQQVGLFSGPAYSVYKALTAIQLATDLTRSGVNAVPVFWLATEDHDLAEVNQCFWLHDKQLTRFELPQGIAAGQPVGRIRLGSEIERLLEEASAKLSGTAAADVERMLRESYASADTYGSAFGKLFVRLFEKHGLILLDPLDARLHGLATPVLRQALEERDALNEKLLERGRQLEKAGFDAQVKVTSRSTLLFRIQGGVRQAITVQNKHYQVGETPISREELMSLLGTEPENFSANALLRPVVQDFLLPTAAYIAGPAETAYYAQSEVLYRQILGKMPVVLPRASFTILEPPIAKMLRRYEISVEDVWAGRERLRARLEAHFVPATLASRFDEAATALERELKNLEKPLRQLDPTLEGALDTARRKMTYQLEKLRQKAGRARDQRDGVISHHEEILTAALYPNRVAQQRSLCFLPFLAAWGLEALDVLRKLAGESLRKGEEIIVGI